jgi:hypothetical protein
VPPPPPEIEPPAFGDEAAVITEPVETGTEGADEPLISLSLCLFLPVLEKEDPAG